MNLPTKQEYLLDVENTKKELAAYKQLVSAYKVLRDLPENSGDLFYSRQVLKYQQSANDCQEFLHKLEGLRSHYENN
jgi:hypothetical protein